MSTELEKIPRMIERAIATLNKATSAGEILEAKKQANDIYDAAKFAAAHGAIMSTCHRMQADALMIEARAQIRLADEYDAAQERGEVATGRDGPGAGVLHGNAKATAADIGLSRKEIHQARLIRDAEQRKPGMIKKILNEKLEAGEEPTRADVKRATARPKKPQPTKSPKPNKVKSEIIEAADRGLSKAEIAEQTGVTERTVRREIEYEAMRRDAIKEAEPEIDAKLLSMTAQQKLDLAIKQATIRLRKEIHDEIHQEMLSWLKGQLDHYREKEKHYNVVIAQRKGIMKRSDYRSILSCLHPDRVRDPELKKRYEHAFNLFTSLEKAVLNEKESPTTLSDLPTSLDGWLKRKADYQAQKAANRAAKRGQKSPTVKR